MSRSLAIPANAALEPADPELRALSHDEETEVARLAATIDVRSPLTVASFGQDIAEKTATYADTLLSKARSADLDDAGAKLNEVIVVAQSFDLSSFDNRWSRAPIVGPVVRQFVMTKERALARFNTVSGQIDKLVRNIDDAARRLGQRAEDLEAMHEGVCEEHASLELHARAARLRLDQLNGEIAALRSTDDTGEMTHAGMLEASRNALEKRVADLTVLGHSAFQTLPMIRIMQANNLVLIEKFQTIQRLTLPAWKRTFTMALALNEQRDAVRLAESIDEATNFFMRKNAELLHDNSVATARANQRLVVDVETLREVHDQVLKTLTDVRAVHAEGARTRAGALVELERLRGEMAASFSAAPTSARAPRRVNG